LNNLAILQQQRGRQKEAEQLRKQATAINRKIFGDNHVPVIPAAQLPMWTQDL
jgi:hypothetical protein